MFSWDGARLTSISSVRVVFTFPFQKLSLKMDVGPQRGHSCLPSVGVVLQGTWELRYSLVRTEGGPVTFSMPKCSFLYLMSWRR